MMMPLGTNFLDVVLCLCPELEGSGRWKGLAWGMEIGFN